MPLPPAVPSATGSRQSIVPVLPEVRNTVPVVQGGPSQPTTLASNNHGWEGSSPISAYRTVQSQANISTQGTVNSERVASFTKSRNKQGLRTNSQTMPRGTTIASSSLRHPAPMRKSVKPTLVLFVLPLSNTGVRCGFYTFSLSRLINYH